MILLFIRCILCFRDYRHRSVRPHSNKLLDGECSLEEGVFNVMRVLDRDCILLCF